LRADNNVSTSKRYQLLPKHKLMQTNYSLITSMTFMFVSATL